MSVAPFRIRADFANARPVTMTTPTLPDAFYWITRIMRSPWCRRVRVFEGRRVLEDRRK